MEYAVIETGGKQYRVQEGETLDIDNLPESKNGQVIFDKILLHVGDTNVNFGKPYISGLMVKGKVIGNIKGDKIRVAKFKAKSKYRKVRGHRQLLTRIQIQDIIKSTNRQPSKI